MEILLLPSLGFSWVAGHEVDHGGSGVAALWVPLRLPFVLKACLKPSFGEGTEASKRMYLNEWL